MTDDEYPASDDPSLVDAVISASLAEILIQVLSDVETVLTRASPGTRAEIDTILAEAGNTGGCSLSLDQVQFTRRDLHWGTTATDVPDA